MHQNSSFEDVPPSSKPVNKSLSLSNCSPTGRNCGDEIKVKVRREGLGTRLSRDGNGGNDTSYLPEPMTQHVKSLILDDDDDDDDDD
jgi:hypothetical protein